MSDELVPVSKYASDELLADLTMSVTMPYVKIMYGTSDLVQSGDFPLGNFALVKGQDHIDLTKEFNAIVLSWRPKAMQFEPELVTVFNPKDKLFQEFRNKFMDGTQGYSCGPEFLLWIPEQQTFAAFFMGSKTANNEAPNVAALMGQACTLKSVLIKGKKHSWHGPSVSACALDLDLPKPEMKQMTLEKFCDPPETVVEAIEAEVVDTRD